MATINPDLSGIVDGQVGDAADWTTPMNTIINAINGGLDNDNITSGANIDHGKILGGVRCSDYQVSASNTSISNQRICIGWVTKTGSAAADRDAKVITFPITYTAAPIVVISPLSEALGAPAAIGDFAGGVLNKIYCWFSDSITTTGFNACFEQRTTGAANGAIQGATWIAIGTKAN